MSYVTVETNGGTGTKELLAAPTKWITWEKGGSTYLRWPNRRHMNTLNTLLNDSESIPSVDWEKHEMSYVIVEISGATGDKELLAAPTRWIKWGKGGLTSLRWPNQKHLSMLNALLNDGGSIPSADWETHKCDLMRRSIPSLDAAERMMERMLQQRKGLAASEAIPVTVQKTEDPMAEEENLHEFSSNLTKVVDGEDPFGDVKPLSQSHYGAEEFD
uniref:Uncharacterized protein n=1 Tax=Anopheles dirus TaxID=7168 RepID=A0A182N3U8_9DIPT